MIFLYQLFEKNYTYSSINTARSSLSAFVQLDTKDKIGTHPKVVRLLKGMFNSRPPTPRYSETWDVAIVLRVLRSWSPRHKLTLKQLTLKLCMLLALLIAPRSQTLKAMTISGLKLNKKQASFKLSQLLKTSRQGKKVGKLLEIEAYPADRRLCPVYYIQEYINRTQDIRKDEDQFFLSYVRDHKAVNTTTIARWIRNVLAQSGVGSQYTAHSVRAASTSAAHMAQVPVEEILSCAGWSSTGTFDRFYRKSITKPSYQKAIMETI